MLSGLSGPAAGASVTVDLTVGAVTQLVFSFVGVAALLHVGVSTDDDLVRGLLIAIVGFGVLILLFLGVQRLGLYRLLARFPAAIFSACDWDKLTGGAQALDSGRRAIAHGLRWRGLSFPLARGTLFSGY